MQTENTVVIEHKNFESLNYLRVIAIGMIVYDHLLAFRNQDFFLVKILQKIFTTPLHILQDFGAFGVCLFYIMSGFLLMNSGNEKNPFIKQVKKIVKIYFSCIGAFAIFFLFNKFFWLFRPTYWSQFTIKQWISSSLLVGYFNGAGEVINGTTWFLIPLFMFYMLGILIKIKGVFVSIVSWCAVLVFCVFVNRSGHYQHVFYFVPFVFVPLTGCVFYKVYSKQIDFWKGVFLSVACYGCFMVGLHEFALNYYKDSPYLVSYVYASVMFILFVIAENHFKPNKAINFFNKCGLTIYLLHMTWGGVIMSELYFAGISFGISFLIAFVIIVLLAYMHQKFIDNGLLRFLK